MSQPSLLNTGMNLLPKPETKIHTFHVFSKWMEAAMQRGWTLSDDKYRKNVFVALDEHGNVVGMFVLSDNFWEGFMFDSHADRVLFEAGEIA